MIGSQMIVVDALIFAPHGSGLALGLGFQVRSRTPTHAGMAELADAVDSKSTAPQRRASSSLAPGIAQLIYKRVFAPMNR